MADAVKTRRRYHSPRRREQAEATRLRILDAAQTLFEQRGYAATSMAAIAEEAGVALKTLYVTFETKSGLLRALWHRLLRGERDEVPVGEQPWFREVLDEPDPGRQIELNVRNSMTVKGRAAKLMQVIQGAASADPEIGALWSRIESEFHDNQRMVVKSLAAKGALRRGLGVERAADILWTLNHPDVYALLVDGRGWPPARYERWLREQLCSQLLDPAAAE